MAAPTIHGVKVVEHCRVHPSPPLPPPTSLPLTFFDIPWLLFSPHQPLFFYHLPSFSTATAAATLPALKHSLSLTLRHYNHLAGHLCAPPYPASPRIVYSQADSVPLTFAESSGDFHHLCGHSSRNAADFHPLVPQLLPSSRDPHTIPLLAVQITLFPGAGVSIGLAFHHAAGDGRTFDNFMKTWAAICRSDGEVTVLPSHDRSLIIDRRGLEGILLKQWRDSPGNYTKRTQVRDMVRATCVVGPTDMDKIKRWIITQKSNSAQLLLSNYVVTCAFVWVCLAKAKAEGKNEKMSTEGPVFFGFVAGGLARLDYPIPATYFGNCVAFGRATVKMGELVGGDGVVAAAKAIGSSIEKLNRGVLEGAERWIPDWELMVGSELHMTVSGSPKVGLYEMDFGWGRPKKIEDISIDGMGAISLTESREIKGGIEIGLVLKRATMYAFTSFFEEGLKVFQ
ncbi:malonyl-coenzyme A:anthocyanin 3-O-glucoside-6''-O-malonyltransferase-like [Malania oleifera]|uniref:malonyl-coenzyme A:anthocyanin 3-O-glucoside-6''-O-malonyltransferase-like n=1 Tax=Malania oleifera TaxID=397392 RepID=UPI0025ADE00E|nr:malonyl-coenzyme A:anthocyanin 3-O-glucoside-6''-O-malonyltransferase-like [Malania oleifera]